MARRPKIPRRPRPQHILPFTQRPLFLSIVTLLAITGVSAMVVFLWQTSRNPTPESRLHEAIATTGAPALPAGGGAVADRPVPAPSTKPATSAPPSTPVVTRARPAPRPRETPVALLPRIDAAYQSLLKGDVARAESEFEAIWRDAPGTPGILRALVGIKASQKRLEDAHSLTVQAQRSEFDPADAQMLYGLITARSGDSASAFSALERSAALRPADAEIYFHWANQLRLMGNTREALKRIDQAVARNRSLGAAYLLETKRWLTLLELEDRAELHRTLDPALGSDPPEANATLVKGIELAIDGQIPDATRAIAEARLRIPSAFYQYLLRDPVIVPLAQRRELAPLLTPTDPGGRASFTEDLSAPLPPPAP